VVPFNQVGVWAVVDGEFPPLPVWEQLIYRVAPLFVPAVFLIELLFAYGCEFKWERASEQAVDRPRSRPMPPRSWLLWCLAVLATPVLIVGALNFAIYVRSGCVHYRQADMGPLWSILPLACIALGIFVFMRAAPAEASRVNKVIRALTYALVMLLFYGDVTGYLELQKLCSFGVLPR
jgi:hypothetical protein